MADKKISALTAATTPLAGTEVLPIVQSSTTVKTTVLSVTNGLPLTPTSVTASSFINTPLQRGIFQAQSVTSPSGAGTLTLTLTWSTTFYGYVDFSIFGSFGASNREGEAAYRVYFQRGNVITKTVTAPEDNSGSFTTSFTFTASSSSGSNVLTVAMGKPSGATYLLVLNSQGSLSDYTLTSSFA